VTLLVGSTPGRSITGRRGRRHQLAHVPVALLPGPAAHAAITARRSAPPEPVFALLLDYVNHPVEHRTSPPSQIATSANVRCTSGATSRIHFLLLGLKHDAGNLKGHTIPTIRPRGPFGQVAGRPYANVNSQLSFDTKLHSAEVPRFRMVTHHTSPRRRVDECVCTSSFIPDTKPIGVDIRHGRTAGLREGVTKVLAGAVLPESAPLGACRSNGFNDTSTRNAIAHLAQDQRSRPEQYVSYPANSTSEHFPDTLLAPRELEPAAAPG
jgi:hypothetical protein